MTPCPHCRTRAAAEYLARGRRRALGNVFWMFVASVVVGLALGVCKSDPSVFKWVWHHV